MFRGIACVLARRSPVVSIEPAHVTPEWASPDVKVFGWSDPQQLVEFCSTLGAEDLVVKVSGALPGRWDRECDMALATSAKARLWYVDADGPSRLPILSYSGTYLEHVLPRFEGVILFGGGSRATHVYRALGASRVLSLTISLAWFGIGANTVMEQTQARFDLAAVFGGGKERADQVASLVTEAARLGYSVGFAGPRIADLPSSVTQYGLLDGPRLADLVATSRFSLSLLRPDVRGFPDVHACRMVEAAKWGSVLLTEAFDGIDRLFTPGRDAFVVSDEWDFDRWLAINEVDRQVMSISAYRHVSAVAEREESQFAGLLFG